MFLKLVIFLFGILPCLAARADGPLIIKPNEIKSICRGSELIVAVGALARLTRSKIQLVKVSTASEGLCLAAKQYVQITKPTTIITSITVKKLEYLLKFNPCFQTMNTCSAIYREVKVENINIQIKQLRLSNSAEIPGTQRDRLAEWDSRFCPPYYPDCDL